MYVKTTRETFPLKPLVNANTLTKSRAECQKVCLETARPGFEFPPGASLQCVLRGGRSYSNMYYIDTVIKTL